MQPEPAGSHPVVAGAVDELRAGPFAAAALGAKRPAAVLGGTISPTFRHLPYWDEIDTLALAMACSISWTNGARSVVRSCSSSVAGGSAGRDVTVNSSHAEVLPEV